MILKSCWTSSKMPRKYTIGLASMLLVSVGYSQTQRMAVSAGAITIGAKLIKYKSTVTESFLPDTGKPATSIITISYEAEQADSPDRPVIFLFNGGPGASSSPLHMRAFGPVRLAKASDSMNQIANVYSLLDVADLVFVDPAGTGFTRIFDTVNAATYWDVVNDAKCIIDIIKRWKLGHHRNASPVFLCGESYGTLRAAKMLGIAEDFPVKGVILLSAFLDLSLVAPISGNEMPFVLSLPSMAAIAFYHNKTIYK